MIPDEVVAEVKARADIVGVIGEFVQLKKAGREFRGLSPFKKEKTPSFYVNPTKAFFHDFSSGESGDVFSFLMKHQGMSFVDAVKYVGARSGVEVREIRRAQGREDPWRPYYEASAYANTFFQERLWEREDGRRAREYLEKRGIGREAGEEFGLGCAPDDWRAFREAAAVHGLEERILLDIGLLKKSEKTEEPYDAFRNRIIFPIESEAGRVLAFGGRLLGRTGKGAPKYLNSPESPIFQKGEVLYGLRKARNHIRRNASVLVVEGFMDVVSLASVDIRNVVAPLGTAMTEAHAGLLKRYTTQVRLLFDSDPAGQRATFRAADILLARGLHASVVTLPDGEDPDSVARSGGAEAVREFVSQAVDVLDRKIAMLEERDYFATIEKTRRALDRLLPTVRAVTDPRLRDIYVARVAERTGVRPETLVEEIGQRAVPPATAPRRAYRRRGRVPPGPTGMGPDQELLRLMLHHRDWIEKAAESIGPSDLADGADRVIFEGLIADPGLVALPEGTSSEAVRRFEQLKAEPGTAKELEQVFAEVLARIMAKVINRRMDGVRARLRSAADHQEKVQLTGDLEELRREKAALPGADWSGSARALVNIGKTQRKREGAQ